MPRERLAFVAPTLTMGDFSSESVSQITFGQSAVRRFAAICVVVGTALSSCAPIRPPTGGPDDRAEEARVIRAIDGVLARPELAQTHVGLAVWSLDRRRWLIDRNADKLFVPASNAKLLVAAAALHTFGPSERFTTTLLSEATPADSVIPGNLYLVGGGNPELATGDLVAFAERLCALGIRRLRGDVVLDASHFDTTAFGPGWMWDEGPYAYNAPISAFMLNGNTVHFTIRPGRSVGDTVRVAVSPSGARLPLLANATTRGDTVSGPPLSVTRLSNSAITLVEGTMAIGSQPIVVTRTVPDPVAYAGAVFLGALRSAGVVVEGGLTTGLAPDSGRYVIATARSAPVDVLVRRFLKESDNLFGEALIKQLGRAANGQGSWAAGASAVRRSLAGFAGLDSSQYVLADGSGLSRYTQLSPRMVVQVIIGASEDFTFAPEFLSALPIGGVDGTLSGRLMDEKAVGYVRGKTGTMSGVSAVSGIVLTDGHERLAFSFLMNGFVGSSDRLRRAQDDLVGLLRRYPALRAGTVP